MIAEKILGNINEFELGERKVVRVYLDWYELDKKLLRKTTEEGEDIGIRMDKRLSDGDILYENQEKIIVAAVQECDLTHVDVKSMKEMGRLCFELGNRHLSLAIHENDVETIYDEPTYLYLEKLGFVPQKIRGVFSDFTVCHAHGHSHREGHAHEL